MLKRTPLYEVHVGLQARMVDFGGWEMPVQYEGIVAEAQATRQRVGLFDIGHMGRLEIVGEDHVQAADWVVTCDVAKLGLGRCKYGIVSTARGTAIDDVLVYRDADRTHLVVNAGNRERDRDHVREQIAAKGFRASVIDAADPADPGIGRSVLGVAQHMLSLQGPRSEALLARLVDGATDLSKLGYYRFTRAKVLSIPALVSRTGYTGEDGFEVFLPAKEAEGAWAKALEAGVAPVGLGARDTLRTEAAMPLYGNDLDATTTPLEAGLGFAVDLDKSPGFIGQEALKAAPPARRLTGLLLDTKRSPRPGHPVLLGGKPAGTVSSGTYSPTLGKSIAMAYLPRDAAAPGTPVEVDVRGRLEKGAVVSLPFYRRQKT